MHIIGKENSQRYGFSDEKWLPKESFGVDEEKVFEIWLDFNADATEVKRDWSVVAWGTEGTVEVTHTNGLTSDVSPVVGDGNRSAPQEIDYPKDAEWEDPPVCMDNDLGGTLYDKDGSPYNCAWYG